ncbi:MAG: NACHT domain-containing protein, partial [Verrucomicrobiota bacterium]
SMPAAETALVAGAVFLGNKALELVSEFARAYVRKRIDRLFEGIEKKLKKEEREALQQTWEETMTHGYGAALDALTNVLRLTGMGDETMRENRTAVLYFLDDEDVGDLLWESVCDLTNNTLPDPAALETRWAETDWELPLPGSAVWPMFAANFREGAKKQGFINEQLRPIINAENIDKLVGLTQQLLGVQVTVRQDQYVRMMQKRYGQVELANVAPSYAEDPGVLFVTDIFEPQHVRENPPPVEITKDEFEKLVREGKIDKDDEDAVIALLEEDEGEEVAERLRFQRASYAEQREFPIFDIISDPFDRAMQHQILRPVNRSLVITGEPGSGKSTLLRYILLSLFDTLEYHPNDTESYREWRTLYSGKNEHFPLLIELRDFYFTCKDESAVNDFLSYITHLGKSEGWGIDGQWLQDRLSSGPSLVMFDGLDEVFDPRDRDEVMRQIAGFAETYPNARIIVTSRPHGYHEGILRPAGFAHFRLQDLDAEQKERFVRAWFARVFPKSEKDANVRIERVLSAIERSPSVRWLAGNPLLLTIMCLIAREKELPRERARFYEQCIDVLAHQWDVNRHLAIEDLEFLTIDDKKDLLFRISFHMQQSDAGLQGNFIGERELLEIVETWFREDHSLEGKEAKLAAKQMKNGLWERNYLLCPRGPRLYGFLHRTFMEYLTAMKYVRRFQQLPDFGIEDLEAVFKKHGEEPEWTEVLRLICGAIGDQWAENLIRALLELSPFPEGAKLNEQNQPNSLVLAIRCLGELRGLSKMEKLGVLALEKCVRFLRDAAVTKLNHPFMESEFIDAVGEIGERWPGRNNYSKLAPTEFGSASPDRAQYFPAFEAIVLRDRERTTNYVLHTDWSVRYQALELLAGREAWADEETRQLLTQRASDDESEYPRSKALELLAGREAWADEETRQLLTQRASDDGNEYP